MTIWFRTAPAPAVCPVCGFTLNSKACLAAH